MSVCSVLVEEGPDCVTGELTGRTEGRLRECSSDTRMTPMVSVSYVTHDRAVGTPVLVKGFCLGENGERKSSKIT